MSPIAGYANQVAFALLGALTVIILLLGVLALRNPVLFKLGLRNIPRRPAQSILIIVGLTLSTIIIVASFATGDTLSNSVRRQAVAAYGNIDEIIAPPLLSMFASMAGGGSDDNPFSGSAASDEAQQTQDQLNSLFEGGLTSVLTVLEGGLPGISTERLAQLKQEANADPQIDGVAGSILFPTIIRNANTGQGEPLGFIFAVDDDYDQTFGLTTIDGKRMEVESLQPGVGNVFAQASNLFAMLGDLGQRLGINLSVSNVATAVAAIGAVVSGSGSTDLASLTIDLATLQAMGIDTTPLEDAGIREINVGEVVNAIPGLGAALGITGTTTLSGTAVAPGGVGATAGLDAGAPVTAPLTVPLTATANVLSSEPLSGSVTTTSTAPAGLLGGIVSQGQELLSSFNLNTLGSELDRALAQAGLQVRQGDVFLNRLGAEKLGAQTGDVLEVFIGPLPVPFRVRAVVEEASPVGALLPVVVMRLDEAQKLLFMQNKVNNVLVSNQGDLLGGLEQTDAVSGRLRELAMDPQSLEATAAILRRADVKPIVVADAARAQENALDPEIPPFVMNILGNFTGVQTLVADIQALETALDGSGVGPELRRSLANSEVRSWLLQRDLPEGARDELAAAFSSLNQFDVLDPLSKQSVLLASDIAGGVFSSLFSIFGFFSVVAGIILIFLIFVMLAAERRSEMGIARAVGVQRRHLVQMFVSEGMVYSLAAAAIGVLIGIAVSFAMIEYLGGIINNLAGQFNNPTAGILEFAFHVTWRSVAISYAMGVLLTFAVVTISSWRVSRLNIVAAIRDLPDDANARRRSFAGKVARWVWPLTLAVIGGLGIYYGIDFSVWSLVLIGATVGLFGVMFLVGRALEGFGVREQTSQRIVYSVIGLALLTMWITPWQSVLPRMGLETMASDPTQILAVFAIGGPMIITGAIMVIMFNATVFTWLVERLFGWIGALTPVLKTAIAYPLSTRFRTGTAMVLFAMIMATVVVMGLVIEATQSMIVMDDRDSGGFQIEASNTLLSFFDPLTDMPSEIERARANYPLLGEIEHVGSVVARDFDASTSDGASDGRVQLAGLSDGFIQNVAPIYPFRQRAEGFADDAAVWEALRTRDDVVVVRPGLVQPAGETGDPSGPEPSPTPEVVMGMEMAPDEEFPGFDMFRLYGIPDEGPLPRLMVDLIQDDGERRMVKTVQVIGVLEPGAMLDETPMQGNVDLVDALLGETVNPEKHFLSVGEGADVRAVAQEVERAFLAHGINATVMADGFAQSQAFLRNILRLLQGFMALGLLVGIAGLGVITTRTVVERRQQVGMLRAIGYQARMVSLSFVLEASFIAVTGLLIGAATGMVLGLNIIRVSFGSPESFHMPWGSLVFVLLLAYGFSLLTTIVPAWQASRIYPAEALRYE